MRRRQILRTGALAGLGVLAGCAGQEAAPAPTDAGGYRVETVTEGLAAPWGLAFVPGGSRLLVTEQPGRLSLVDHADGTTAEVTGTPDVDARGQGGLLDVTLHPTYPAEPYCYLTYSARTATGPPTTHLGRGRLDTDRARLDGFTVLHRARPPVTDTRHYGSRVVFGPDGMVYLTVGDRHFKNFGPDHVSQDTTTDLGSVLRLTPEGGVPPDNPFVDDPGARDVLFTYGHRNPQGLTVHPETGELWVAEHGERDGDEINVLLAGANYGWPVASEACRYGTQRSVGVSHEQRSDVVGPAHVWECGSGGFPPSGTTVYDGDSFPEWQGDLFVGTLAGQYLGRFGIEGSGPGAVVTQKASLLAERDWRIRAVAVAPDTGQLYVVPDADPAPLARLVPA